MSCSAQSAAAATPAAAANCLPRIESRIGPRTASVVKLVVSSCSLPELPALGEIVFLTTTAPHTRDKAAREVVRAESGLELALLRTSGVVSAKSDAQDMIRSIRWRNVTFEGRSHH